MRQAFNIRKTVSYDVCVCGGGPAGFCAAVAAGRNGVRTALVERYGLLGGAMTVGGIPVPALFHAHGRQVISGIGWELMTYLADKGWARLPEPPYLGSHPDLAVRVNAFQAAKAMDDFCRQTGVDLYFHQPIVETAMRDERIAWAFASTKEGLLGIEAEVFVDCTGDADVAAFAGVPYELGETLQPGSFNVRMEGIAEDKIDQAQADRLFTAAVVEGRLELGDIWSGKGRHTKSLWQNKGSNLNHISLNGADSDSRTHAELYARESVDRLLRWMKAEVPGSEKAAVAAVSPETWPRESRRIIGKRRLTGEAYIAGEVTGDAVCYSFYPVDIHTDDADTLINCFHEEGKVPGIPYGCLVPASGCSNLLVAGRCASGDRAAQSAFRVQASCMAMGQAAGTAAAMAAVNHVRVDVIDVARLRELLALQGMIVP